ncbi:hypothetical protein QOT17_000830 [Balamuthia mandrillaris]
MEHYEPQERLQDIIGRRREQQTQQTQGAITAPNRSWLSVKWLQWQIVTSQYMLFPFERFVLNVFIFSIMGLALYRVITFAASLFA